MRPPSASVLDNTHKTLGTSYMLSINLKQGMGVKTVPINGVKNVPIGQLTGKTLIKYFSD